MDKLTQELHTAESEILDRLVGVAQNVVILMEVKLRKLREAAGRSPVDSTRHTDLEERTTAVDLCRSFYMQLADEYPEIWDEKLIPAGDDRDELAAELRERVKAAVKKVWTI